MKNPFETEYKKILEKLSLINPISYGRTRNHIEGDVTRISPYLTHGVISLPFVRDVVLKKYSTKDSYTFIFELAWREFFQRVYDEEEGAIFHDLKSEQRGVLRKGLPEVILNSATGIVGIDTAYKLLYATGYMHNHARMWSAMLLTNIGHYAWWDVSRHLYYYLLDGDKASNTLSWQWVAGSFSSKQYFANQEMINKFSKEKQKNTFLDTDVSLLSELNPEILSQSIPFTLQTDFSLFQGGDMLGTLVGESFLLYSIWTLDSVWSPREASVTKVLFIDRDELTVFPMSRERISFILELAKNIDNLHVALGTKSELKEWAKNKNIFRKHHPALKGWPGIVSAPEYLFPQIVSVPRGFMSFWKKCEGYL